MNLKNITKRITDVSAQRRYSAYKKAESLGRNKTAEKFKETLADDYYEYFQNSALNFLQSNFFKQLEQLLKTNGFAQGDYYDEWYFSKGDIEVSLAYAENLSPSNNSNDSQSYEEFKTLSDNTRIPILCDMYVDDESLYSAVVFTNDTATDMNFEYVGNGRTDNAFAARIASDISKLIGHPEGKHAFLN